MITGVLLAIFMANAGGGRGITPKNTSKVEPMEVKEAMHIKLLL